MYPSHSFSSIVTSCKYIVQYYNQDIDIDRVNTQNISIHKGPPCCTFITTSTSLSLAPPQPLATTHLFSYSIIMSFQECDKDGTIQFVIWGFFFSLSIIPWRFIQVVESTDNSFLFIAKEYSMI